MERRYHKKAVFFTVFIIVLLISCFASADVGGRYLEYPESEPSQKVFIEYNGHVQRHGDTPFFKQPLSCGTVGEHRRLEGFLIRLAKGSENIGLIYRAHIQDQGDTAWKHLNEYVGTKGKGLRLEGFEIKITGDAIKKYDVNYCAHLAGTGDTGWYRNGQYCGTRGQKRRVEAISVYISEK